MPRPPKPAPTPAQLESTAAALRDACGALRFGAPVAFTYNPLDYAWEAHRAFIARARHRPTALFVGMNPGPFGMAQTGVPFGEVASVRGFLGIDERTARIGAPARMHPKRPVEGFACARSEVSGARVWTWAAARFGTADAFFRQAFVWNWCPLAFMADSGANLTPDKLPRTGRGATAVRALEVACDTALGQAIAALQPRHVVGFGAFAAERATAVLDGLRAGGADARTLPPVHQVLHPSPASPAANRGWAPQVDAQLAKAGVEFAARRTR
jgi:single-strand selective monofunctional uracil DNA glycosylase